MNPSDRGPANELLQQLRRRYPNYFDLPGRERVVLAMAELADTFRVKERGRNRGRWVDQFLSATSVPPGSPWCASAIAWVCDLASVPRPRFGAASVARWRSWAMTEGRISTKPRRGDLCYWIQPNGLGHIGVVVRAGLGTVISIEGNTSPEGPGSQRDGDGLYRRIRPAGKWDGFIRL